MTSTLDEDAIGRCTDALMAALEPAGTYTPTQAINALASLVSALALQAGLTQFEAMAVIGEHYRRHVLDQMD